MKRTIKRIGLILLLITLCMLTGCSSFFAEEVLQIGSIEHYLLPDGQTRITITYTDDTIEPYVFYIPRGQDGAAGASGNGIEKLEYKHNPDTKKTEITISFTDKKHSPITFEVPDGKSIVKIGENTDEQGKYLYFEDSEGNLSQNFYLPRGEAGIGIDEFNCVENEDGSVDFLMTFTDGREPVNIHIPKPQEGTGIASMVERVDPTGLYYYIDITYTNGETDEIKFRRPTQWHYGTTAPTSLTGNEGDFYIDTMRQTIYVKEGAEWVKIISLRSEEVTYKVSFKLNDTAAAPAAWSKHGQKTEFDILKGSYFTAYADIPIPSRPGYRFVGWYTKMNVDPTTMSPFTDLTPVFSDLVLYAIWEPIA